jgi:hypothetical protein
MTLSTTATNTRSLFTQRSVVVPGPKGAPGGRPSLPDRRPKEETFWRGAWTVTAVQVARADACGVADDTRRHRRAR